MGAIFALIAVVSASIPAPQAKPDPLTLELQTFLESKGSPMPAAVLTKYDNWQMIVAISAAESGYGKKLAGDYNAWGIKDFRTDSPNFRGYRNFASWDESIDYTANLLYKYDEDDGSPEPKAMVARWKTLRPFGGWLGNVNYSLHDIQENVIAVVEQQVG